MKNGMIVQIDKEFLPIFRRHRWYFNRIHGYFSTLTKILSGVNEILYMHNLVMGKKSGFDTDHINGDKLDNRKKNLRFCTRSQNLMNKTSMVGTSKYKGVRLKRGKWESNISIDGKKRHLGYFDSEEDAAHMYNMCAALHFGEFARLNDIEPCI